MAQFDQDQRGNVPRKYYDGELAPYEEFWRDLSPWLEERGYKLRPRYQLGWKPSWAGTDNFLDDCEDGVIPRVRTLTVCTIVHYLVFIDRTNAGCSPHLRRFLCRVQTCLNKGPSTRS